ncbi:hypothetical protein [Ideonella paludis]|uniref:DUF1631 domain-containing protein n=1 Tax=Ideonella paludis TaxID=1233411 RepID=A0ABS5E021_9BURK|nr:hypothetical protein [Ideonella paludis]MBQ0936664.1 hypothetical protein [Ideonella paludis]
MQAPRDVAAIRLENALSLFDEFVRLTAKHADAATLRGLEGRFAERLQIQPSYWSQIKGRSRQIGERLARQFEQCCHKPAGWMDQVHSATPNAAAAEAQEAPPLPQDDDERFIVGLVLTYYRRHPTRAKKALLNLLGDVLEAPGKEAPLPAMNRGGAMRPAAAGAAPGASPAAPAPDADQALWQQMQRGIAPLKSKR